MTIRPCSKADLDEIVTIEQSVQLSPWRAQQFLDCLAHGDTAFICQIKQKIVGYIICRTVIDEAEILTLAVCAEQQGQGYGKQLLHAVIAHCQKQQIKTLFLDVHEANERAINFYQQQGWQMYHRRKNYYHTATGRQDALLMRADLNTIASN